MRYVKLRSAFWTSDTGRALRDSPEARVLALYFMSGPLANVYGLYHVSLESARHDTGLSERALRDCLKRLEGLEYLSYDPRSEFVWVHEMAAHQLDLPLLPHDYNVRNAQRWYAACPKNPWLGPFWERYAAGLHLIEKREYVPVESASRKPLGSPSQAPPKGQLSTRSLDQGSVLEPVRTEFEAFWLEYPRKDSKKAAWQAWLKLRPTPELLAVMRAAVQRQCTSEQWTRDAGKGIPYLATWLNGERWKDEGASVPRASRQTLDTLHAVQSFLDDAGGAGDTVATIRR